MKTPFLFTLTLVLTLGVISCSGKESKNESDNEAKEQTKEATSEDATKRAMAQVDESLLAIIKTMEEDNAATCRQFECAVKQNPEKIMLWYDKAVSIRKASNDFYAYVQTFKEDYARNEGNVAILKGKINEYRDFMIEITDYSPDLDEDLRQTFATANGAEGEPISWSDAMFNEMPMSACVTLLTKLQVDIRHCEGRAIRYLLTQTDASDLRVNKFDAYVIPVSSQVQKGDEYKAQIVLALSDPTLKSECYVDGKLVENGYYVVKTDKVGKHKICGSIAYKNHVGQIEYIPFEKEYTVVE